MNIETKVIVYLRKGGEENDNTYQYWRLLDSDSLLVRRAQALFTRPKATPKRASGFPHLGNSRTTDGKLKEPKPFRYIYNLLIERSTF